MKEYCVWKETVGRAMLAALVLLLAGQGILDASPSSGGTLLSIVSSSFSPDPFSPNGDGVFDSHVLQVTYRIDHQEGIGRQQGGIMLLRHEGAIVTIGGSIRSFEGESTIAISAEDRTRGFTLVTVQHVWDGTDDSRRRVSDGTYGAWMSAALVSAKGNAERTLAVAPRVNGTVTIDTVPPEISNIAPQEGKFLFNELRPTISADFSDPSGIDASGGAFVLDGEDLTSRAQFTSEGFIFTPSEDLAANGDHVFVISVADAVGNRSEVTTRFRIVDPAVAVPGFTVSLVVDTKVAPPGGGFFNVTGGGGGNFGNDMFAAHTLGMDITQRILNFNRNNAFTTFAEPLEPFDSVVNDIAFPATFTGAFGEFLYYANGGEGDTVGRITPEGESKTFTAGFGFATLLQAAFDPYPTEDFDGNLWLLSNPGTGSIFEVSTNAIRRIPAVDALNEPLDGLAFAPPTSSFTRGLYFGFEFGAIKGVNLLTPAETVSGFVVDSRFGTIRDIAFSPPLGPFGDHLYVANKNGTIWRVDPSGTVDLFFFGLDDLKSISFTKMGEMIVNGAFAGNKQIWRVEPTAGILNEPPVIVGTVPDLRTDGNSPIAIDLTPFESDVEDGPAALTWSVSGVDTSVYSISIDPVTDILTLTPVPFNFTVPARPDRINVVLRDSGGLTDVQHLRVTIDPVPIRPGFTKTEFVRYIDDPVLENPRRMAASPGGDFGDALYVQGEDIPTFQDVQIQRVPLATATGQAFSFSMRFLGIEPSATALQFPPDLTGPYGNFLYVTNPSAVGWVARIFPSGTPEANTVDSQTLPHAFGNILAGAGDLAFDPTGDFGGSLYVLTKAGVNPVSVNRIIQIGPTFAPTGALVLDAMDLTFLGRLSGFAFAPTGGGFDSGLYFHNSQFGPPLTPEGQILFARPGFGSLGLLTQSERVRDVRDIAFGPGGSSAFGSDLYVASKEFIMRIDSSGTIRSFASGFDTILEIDFATDGCLYVLDDGGVLAQRIWKICGTVPANRSPTITLSNPNGGETYVDAAAANEKITWIASDPDGDTVTVDIFYSIGDGPKVLIAGGVSNTGGTAPDTGSFTWDVTDLQDSCEYRIHVRASDGSLFSAFDRSDGLFQVNNSPPVLRFIEVIPPEIVTHLQNFGPTNETADFVLYVSEPVRNVDVFLTDQDGTIIPNGQIFDGISLPAGVNCIPFDGRDGTGVLLARNFYGMEVRAEEDCPPPFTASTVTRNSVIDDQPDVVVNTAFPWRTTLEDLTDTDTFNIDAVASIDIEFNLYAAGGPPGPPQLKNVQVDVTIEDETGSLVKTVFSGILLGDPNGAKYVFPWDGTDSSFLPVAFGIYRYRITARSIAGPPPFRTANPKNGAIIVLNNDTRRTDSGDLGPEKGVSVFSRPFSTPLTVDVNPVLSSDISRALFSELAGNSFLVSSIYDIASDNGVTDPVTVVFQHDADLCGEYLRLKIFNPSTNAFEPVSDVLVDGKRNRILADVPPSTIFAFFSHADRTPPQVKDLVVTPGTLRFRMTDEGENASGIKADSIDVSVDGLPLSPVIGGTGDRTVEVEAPLGLPLGDHALEIRGWDVAGNIVRRVETFRAGLVGAEIRVEPEALEINPGVLTAFVRLPVGFDLRFLDTNTATLDGAFPFQSSLDLQGERAVFQFRREDVEDALARAGKDFDTTFEFLAEWSDGVSLEPLLIRGSGTIQKIVE